MRNLRLRILVIGFAATAAIARSITLATATSSIRFCCTPQQSAACAAQGGTASCRTNVCQCLF
jgi:cytochrome c-type biogenesis protein CcmE